MLLDAVIRRLLGDDHVVDVALTETSGGDAHEPGLLLEFFQVPDAAITPSASKPPDELLHQTAQRTPIGYAAFHALPPRPAPLGRILEIAVARPPLPRPHRTQA